MFVYIYAPESDELIFTRRMGPHEKMDARKFADKIADDYGTSISDASGHIPNCCGDIRVEFRPRRDNGTVIWSGESFYFEQGE
jgi:hypothetical protein